MYKVFSLHCVYLLGGRSGSGDCPSRWEVSGTIGSAVLESADPETRTLSHIRKYVKNGQSQGLIREKRIAAGVLNRHFHQAVSICDGLGIMDRGDRFGPAPGIRTGSGAGRAVSRCNNRFADRRLWRSGRRGGGEKYRCFSSRPVYICHSVSGLTRGRRCRGGEIGRRAAFRAQFSQGSGGSSPPLGTIFQIRLIPFALGGATWAQIPLNIQEHCIALWEPTASCGLPGWRLAKRSHLGISHLLSAR